MDHCPEEESRRPVGDLSLQHTRDRHWSEELTIIHNDNVASEPNPEKHVKRHESMNLDGKEYCPNNWFEIDKDVTQEGFCEQLSWKCCFVCVCLPVCYPCYFTRTIRYLNKMN